MTFRDPDEVSRTQTGLLYLEVEDVADGLGGGAVGEGGLAVDHLVRYEPQGPPVTLHPVESGLAPLHSGQGLRGQEVLGAHGGQRGHHLNNTPVIRSTEPDGFIEVNVFRLSIKLLPSYRSSAWQLSQSLPA